MADYGQILAPETLGVARRAESICTARCSPNIATRPINWAIYHGDLETGVSVIHDADTDAGPLLAQAATLIDQLKMPCSWKPAWPSSGRRWWPTPSSAGAGETKSLVQYKSLASPARRLRKTDGEVAWRAGRGDLKPGASLGALAPHEYISATDQRARRYD